METDVDKLDNQISISSELYRAYTAYQNDGMKNLIFNYKAIKEAVMSNEFKSTTANDEKYGPTIKITNNDKYLIGFGIKKAEAILDQLEEIKAFVEANKTTKEVDTYKLTTEQQTLVQSFTKK